MPPFLELRNLAKVFPSFVLGPLSLTLRTGRVLGVLGPNGAGKTTLINLLTMQAQASDGELLHNGHRLAWGDRQWKERFAYVREVPAFYGELTVEEILRLSRGLYRRWDSGLALRTAQRFGLNLRQTVDTLSKGTRVKLGIASAIGHQADFLVLDEPTAGVDPTARLELHTILQEVRRDRPELCVLLSSHLFEDLETAADDLVILRNGRVVFESSSDHLRNMTVYRCPEHTAARTFEESLLTWSAGGHRWVVARPDSAAGLRMRAASGCVEEPAERLLPLIYHATGHLARQDGQ